MYVYSQCLPLLQLPICLVLLPELPNRGPLLTAVSGTLLKLLYAQSKNEYILLLTSSIVWKYQIYM